MGKITEEKLLKCGFKRVGLTSFAFGIVRISQMLPTNLNLWEVTVQSPYRGLSDLFYTQAMYPLAKFVRLCGAVEIAEKLGAMTKEEEE